MTETFTHWDPVDELKTRADQTMYLNACLEEDPGDGSLVRAALGDIARARGMSQLARDSGVSREGLYRALASDGGDSARRRPLNRRDLRRNRTRHRR